MLRAILFDLGDTLFDFDPMDTRAVFREASTGAYEYLQSRGATLAPFDRFFRSQFRACRWAYLTAKLRRREFNSLDLLRRFCRNACPGMNEADVVELAWRWYTPLLAYTRVEPGLPRTLATLRDAGLKLGLVSNTFVPGVVLDRHLRLAGLLDFLPVRVFSSEVGYRKPDARIFHIALRRLDVLPEEAIFVGDLVKTDMIGARRVGMRTAMKQPWMNVRSHRLADHVIRRINELEGIIWPTCPAGSPPAV